MDFIIKGNDFNEPKNSKKFYKELSIILPRAKILDSRTSDYSKFKKRVQNNSKVLGFSRGCSFASFNKRTTSNKYTSVSIGCSVKNTKKIIEKDGYSLYKNDLDHWIINNIKDETLTKEEGLKNHWIITPEMKKVIVEIFKNNKIRE